MNTTVEQKKKIAKAVNETWPHQFPPEFEPEILGQIEDEVHWILVEKSRITGHYHLSLHMDSEELSRYQVSQEYAEDWEPLVAVNLSNASVWRLSRGFTLSFVEPVMGILSTDAWIPA